ncbi:hypothetical protein GOODEAATRI_016217 [Goodea atripinnis]|uniref:Uncharacterized protein n=1 Tax=Goodea atripinnis TaxID=208336 RepID=A0ABV0PP22_9TELE
MPSGVRLHSCWLDCAVRRAACLRAGTAARGQFAFLFGFYAKAIPELWDGGNKIREKHVHARGRSQEKREDLLRVEMKKRGMGARRFSRSAPFSYVRKRVSSDCCTGVTVWRGGEGVLYDRGRV